MRVAICFLSLLGIASSEAGLTQAVDAGDAPGFHAAVPVVAMNSTAMNGTRLAVPSAFAPKPARPNTQEHARLAPVAAAEVSAPLARVASAPVNVRAVGVARSVSLSQSVASRDTAAQAAKLAPAYSTVLPRQPARSMTDHLLTGFVAAMLIAYQLRRKHRLLRPHLFSN